MDTSGENRTVIVKSIGSQRSAIEMHEKRKGDQAMWLNSVCGARVPWLEPEG